MKKILIVGAGFSGAVLARQLAELAGIKSLVIDSRHHIGGNCHTERDGNTGIMIHCYGPHIFHTDNERVWKYIQRFTDIIPYRHRVKASIDRGVFSLPINLHTINQFFNKKFNPHEAKLFIERIGSKTIKDPINFEEQALKFLGEELYRAFFYGYTKKQWGCEPTELPASILKRLPVRFDYDDSYHLSKYSGIPVDGYSACIGRILKHDLIEVKLNTSFESNMSEDFDHVFYTGPIDAYFEHKFGRLAYRTVFWERLEESGDIIGCSQMNFTETNIKHTRIHEDKHFTPWEKHEKSVALIEYSKETSPTDIPYYPKRLPDDMALLNQYCQLASVSNKTSFLGRLATYRYMDMHQVIAEALEFSEMCLNSLRLNKDLPVFPNNIK